MSDISPTSNMGSLAADLTIVREFLDRTNIPAELTVTDRDALISQIKELLQTRRAKLVAHYYTDSLLQDLAEETDGFVRISKRTDKTYTITFFENDEKRVSQAFSKSIKGYNILNLITTTDNKITNTFYGFTVNGNSLTYFDVNRALKKDGFSSKKELLDFFEKNISKEDFFQDPIELKKNNVSQQGI